MNGKTFTASYSSGKDSTLAIYRAIRSGLLPKELILTYNTEKKLSWFHGVPEEILSRLEKAIGIPIRLIHTEGGSEYEKNFEEELARQKAGGADICVFGDIDLLEHRKWCSDRCMTAGLEACFPLWKKSREDVVREFIANGFSAHITVVDTERMDESYLGKKLTSELLRRLQSDGVDVCGENGEYHTFVSDGPLFHRGVEFHFGTALRQGKYALLPVEP